jgi:hypothetical protein
LILKEKKVFFLFESTPVLFESTPLKYSHFYNCLKINKKSVSILFESTPVYMRAGIW